MKTFRLIIFFIVLVVCLQAIKVVAVDYDLWADNFSGGAGIDNSLTGDYSMESTLGEAFPGNIASNDYTVAGGSSLMEGEQILSFIIDEKAVNFGVLVPNNIVYATHSMSAYTNYDNGYNIYISNDPPKQEDGYTITAIGSTAAAPDIKTEQFGINLVANSGQGANPVGGVGHAAANYNTSNKFAFNKDDMIAQANTFSENTIYTVTIMMNFTTATRAGHYHVVMNYSLVPNY